MARGPDEASIDIEMEDEGSLAPDDLAFVTALERIIDGALERNPRGDTFVYGIHQELSAAIGQALTRRYLAAGWREAKLSPGATGAYLLVLRP